MTHHRLTLLTACIAASSLHAAPKPAQSAASAPTDGPVYRCPGPPVIYTDAITQEQAIQQGCKVIEGTPVPVPVERQKQPKPQRSAVDWPSPIGLPEVAASAPPPRTKRELGPIDRWRYESCMENANKSPTALGVRSGHNLCNEKFGQ